MLNHFHIIDCPLLEQLPSNVSLVDYGFQEDYPFLTNTINLSRLLHCEDGKVVLQVSVIPPPPPQTLYYVSCRYVFLAEVGTLSDKALPKA